MKIQSCQCLRLKGADALKVIGPAVRLKRVVRVHASAKDDGTSSGVLLQKVGAAAMSVVLGGALMAAPMVAPPPAPAETQMLRLPASSDPGIFAAQRTMVEAWTIVGETFVDENLNGRRWEEELRDHMLAAFHSDNADDAYGQIQGMLDDLGDPYTRRVPPEDYQKFKVSAEGELQGVGLLIANEPTAGGHLLVLAPIKGGPADRAGILPGDEVLSINGSPTLGLSTEQAAKLLRGQGGTEVRVKLARRSEQIPGVPGRPEARPTVQYKDVALRRERVNLSPLFYTSFMDDAGQKVGYIRLTQFSGNAADEMREAIQELEGQGASSYILDLRNNPGGLVQAGIDVAALWLDGDQVVFNVQGREGYRMAQTTESAAPALTKDPLVVLVNEMSASASEILSGALRDNARAVIVGDTATYGKGRIQSVFELQDGSALFVTVAKYQTPHGTDIDLKGIRPDTRCHAPMLSPRWTASLPLRLPAAPQPITPNEDQEEFSPGLPMGAAMEAALVTQLQADSCVLAAEQILDAKVGAVAAKSIQVGVKAGSDGSGSRVDSGVASFDSSSRMRGVEAVPAPPVKVMSVSAPLM
mmetsp:Transcript_25512/g.55512  ORF Transcript_25512/g.55512 Transcript_25512/m.55512 type:complete len:585 (+) Transcript_25512:49-1803(+)